MHRNKMDNDKLKHTQGPWEINPRSKTTVMHDNISIAVCGGWNDNQRNDVLEEQIMNAVLISNTPVMLKAIKRFINDYECGIMRLEDYYREFKKILNGIENPE